MSSSPTPPSRPTELRCANSLHGILIDEFIEIKCQKSYCRPHPHAVVLHRFNTRTGELVDTKYYMNPEESA